MVAGALSVSILPLLRGSGPGGLGRVAGENIDVPAAQRPGRFATALKRHKTDALVVLPRCAHQQRGLDPVLAAQRASSAKYHAARIGPAPG